jgi:ZIP family zinc transporter/zinc and cadmium transporter
MVGVSLCAFFDGVAIASTVAVAGAVASVQGTTATGTEAGTATGWLLLAGLFPHKLLEGASIALLLVGAGVTRHAVWFWVAVVAFASPVGGLAVQFALSPTLEASLLGFAAGLLLHLVASERVPGFRGPLQRVQALVFVAGVGTYALTASIL